MSAVPAAVATAVAVVPEPRPAPVYDVVRARASLAGASGPREWTEPPPELVERLKTDFPKDAPPKPPSRFAGFLAVGAILVNAATFLTFRWLVHRHAMENADALKYGAIVTLGLYAVVGAGVVWTVRAERHPLRWRGVRSIAAGVAFGALSGYLLAHALTHGTGRGDPRFAVLASEGDAWHIAAVILIAVVAAPIVEEVLFRGLLLAHFSGEGQRYALWASGFAFAVWHINLDPRMLLYYTLMGVWLGRRYLLGGLTCSIATHAAFNGVLTAMSIAYVLSPGAVVTNAGMTLRTPRGWHASTNPVRGSWIDVVGPSASEVIALAWTPSAAHATGEPRQVVLPAGDAVRTPVTIEGHDAELVVVESPHGMTYRLLFVSGGSDHARADFDLMLERLQVT